MYKVVCVDERAAQPEYDIVAQGDEHHRPVATFYHRTAADEYVEWLHRRVQHTNKLGVKIE